MNYHHITIYWTLTHPNPVIKIICCLLIFFLSITLDDLEKSQLFRFAVVPAKAEVM